MSVELAERLGTPVPGSQRLKVDEATSLSIAELVSYLAGSDAKVLEQEEIDPALPKLTL